MQHRSGRLRPEQKKGRQQTLKAGPFIENSGLLASFTSEGTYGQHDQTVQVETNLVVGT